MSEYDHNQDRDRHREQGEGIIRKYERYMYGGRVARDRIEENSPNATIEELDEDDIQILDLVGIDEKQELTPEDEREINQVFQAGIPTAIVGTYGTTLGTKVIWQSFAKVIIQRFGVVAAQALGLSAADGLLPVGEAIALGLLAVTAWQIYRNWDELWRDAEQILVGQEREPQIYTTPTDSEVDTERTTGHAPPKVETGTPGYETPELNTPRHTGGQTTQKPTAEDYIMESVSLPYPKLAPGDTVLGDKLRSLGFKPNDIKRIYISLEKTGGGQAVADWIKSGQFDDVKGYDEIVKFAKNGNELASVYQTLEAGEILLRQGYRIVFEQKNKDNEPSYDIDLAISGTGNNYFRVIQLKYLESLKKFEKNVNKAASQLVNVKSQEKLIQIRIDQGTYQEFVDSGKETRLLDKTKRDYPDIKIKIEFSDGITEIY